MVKVIVIGGFGSPGIGEPATEDESKIVLPASASASSKLVVFVAIVV